MWNITVRKRNKVLKDWITKKLLKQSGAIIFTAYSMYLWRYIYFYSY